MNPLKEHVLRMMQQESMKCKVETNNYFDGLLGVPAVKQPKTI